MLGIAEVLYCSSIPSIPVQVPSCFHLLETSYDFFMLFQGLYFFIIFISLEEEGEMSLYHPFLKFKLLSFVGIP